MIWLLNPCHVLTVLSLVTLAAPGSRAAAWLGPLLHCWLAGPLLALLFPVTNTLLLPGEVTFSDVLGCTVPAVQVTVYWLQHSLLVIAPLTTPPPPPPARTAWAALAYSTFSLYHWLVLQPVGLITQVSRTADNVMN